MQPDVNNSRYIKFKDLLYGEIELPEWITPFLRLPEFVRLRGVRLSNVDSYQFKDFNGPTRWEHGLAVASLACKCAEFKKLGPKESAELILSGLLHDIATPPFGHTAEYVLGDYDHEIESMKILDEQSSENHTAGTPIFASQLPMFRRTCASVSKDIGIKINPDDVAQSIVGSGPFGFLINGTLDLDNADNVTRACLHLGMDVDKNVPLRVVKWLSELESPVVDIKTISHEAVRSWVQYRNELYSTFFHSSEQESGREAFLQHIMRRALAAGFPRTNLIWNTDERLLVNIEEFESENSTATTPLRELVSRYRLLEPPTRIAKIEIFDAELLRLLKNPIAITWLGRELCAPKVEIFPSLRTSRFDTNKKFQELLPIPTGTLDIYKLGKNLKVSQLPQWIQAKIPKYSKSGELPHHISNSIETKVSTWIGNPPWNIKNSGYEEEVVSRLNHVGDWGFRMSKNENIHPYPGTFVHAIPATLIAALGLRGSLILDPFGGTGRTAIEAIRGGGSAISCDSNYFATLLSNIAFRLA